MWLWPDGSEILWGDGSGMLSGSESAASSPSPTAGGLPPRRIKRETIHKRGRTLRELFEPSPRVPVTLPDLPAVAAQPATPDESVSRETLAQDFTPLLEGLASLREAAAAVALAQAIEEDDAEILMLVA